MIELKFTPWRRLTVVRDKSRDRIFLHGAGRAAALRMMDAQLWPKSGRTYYRRGRLHRASAPGEYPAKDTGALRASVDYTVAGITRMEIGTQMFYAYYLRYGTSKMKPRKMSDAALRETFPKSIPLLIGFARFEVAK